MKRKNNATAKNDIPIEYHVLKERLEAKLLTRGVSRPESAADNDLYEATVGALKDILIEKRGNFKRIKRASGVKKICYLCMEFLVGRSLKNVAVRLGVFDTLKGIFSEYGKSFDAIYDIESDPGLGNGGLGRLAACFMDSLSAMNYAANGYSLLYENGLFKQRIVDGEQIELADEWLVSGGAWLVPHPEKSVYVRLGGKIRESWESGRLKVVNYEYDEIKAVPYDLLIPGVGGDTVNTIRLWRAKPSSGTTDVFSSSQSGYIRNIAEKDKAEIITRQLYPKDDYDEGKLLRLSQQYFLVSASLQSIINDYFAEHGTLSGFEDNVSLHINDTHPALCIPELMRILMDIYSYSWDDAWEIVVKCVSYTNHTVLPEALEVWRVELFSMKLPRIYSIVNEINSRFTADLWTLYPGDWDRISRMAIIAYNQVRMANLSVVGSHVVNGVSRLHSEILRTSVFRDFYKMSPWKFTNVTNGVDHRRWLCNSNPKLTDFIRELTGVNTYSEPLKLKELRKFENDPNVFERLNQIKKENKESFAEYIYKKQGISIDPNSVFDVQIKRMHEYKRQLLNLLKIISICERVSDGTCRDPQPETFIFGCKAAPGYVMAKKFIKLISYLAKEIESNMALKEKIKLVFVEEYNVSIAEVLIPAADLSEQISLAGKEASGTGCMKLMMNGAPTIGTLDGANVEILEAVGRENMYLFGMNTQEVEQMWRNGYNSKDYYMRSEEIKQAVDRLYSPIGGEDFSYIAEYLIGGHGVSDPFMCLADFKSYMLAHDAFLRDFSDEHTRARRSLINIAESGIFSADVSIRRYAEEIWHASPVGGFNV